MGGAVGCMGSFAHAEDHVHKIYTIIIAQSIEEKH